MNISILLPYKENFSPEYPGAVSLFVYETTRISRFKRDITVYGNTSFKKKFNLKYKNITFNPVMGLNVNFLDNQDWLLGYGLGFNFGRDPESDVNLNGLKKVNSTFEPKLKAKYKNKYYLKKFYQSNTIPNFKNHQILEKIIINNLCNIFTIYISNHLGVALPWRNHGITIFSSPYTYIY